MLIDGGRSKTRINDRLSTLGITDLDAVLATHSDADHIAGLVEVFGLYDIERFYWNGQLHDTQTFQDLMTAAESEGSAITVSRSGDIIPLGTLTIQVLHPASLSGDSNVDSIVVLVSCGTMEVLLTGDAEIPSEQDMLTAGVLVDIDVLKVGHHGSRSSTSEGFLTAVVPEVGLISAGLNSQYGHPHQEVVDRLLGAGVVLYHTDTTDQDDTILMTSDCQSVGFARADALSVSLDPWMSPSAASEPTATPMPTATVTATATAQPTTRQPLVGDVLINEFLPNPNTGNNEWIELYNTSSDVLDVSGMWLDDIASGGSSPKQIPLGTVIAPGGYYVRDMGGAYLNNGGDDVRLLSADQITIFDSFSYSSSQKGVSYCRQPDGGTWSSTCAPSLNAEN